MAKRSNHYDLAFEEMLRRLRKPYVAVNEQRRALCQQSSLKSMDFIVTSQQEKNLLIDVKGRRLAPRSRVWRNWASADDISSLQKWEGVFGQSFRSLLVFAYDVAAGGSQQHDLLWDLLGRRYAFYGVWVSDYSKLMSTYSPSWNTVQMHDEAFRRLRMPILDLI